MNGKGFFFPLGVFFSSTCLPGLLSLATRVAVFIAVCAHKSLCRSHRKDTMMSADLLGRRRLQFRTGTGKRAWWLAG